MAKMYDITTDKQVTITQKRADEMVAAFGAQMLHREIIRRVAGLNAKKDRELMEELAKVLQKSLGTLWKSELLA